MLLSVCVTAWTAVAGAQQARISYADVAALTAPAPQHRIAYGPGPLQFGHLRLPTRPWPHPVVILIHGGCWLKQYDIAHLAALEHAIATAGYAVWSLEYRRVGDDGGGWPGTFQDIARGADHLRALAAAHHLDLDRVVASGHSAGGAFALWLAARNSIPRDSELWADTPIMIRGVLGLAPAPDLEALHSADVCGKVINGLLGGSPVEQPARYRATSLMQLAPLRVPQILVVGAHDRSWAPIGRAYHARALAVGDSGIRLIEAPESGHFDMIAPATASGQLVLTALAELFDVVARRGAAR
jgi:acetyl esterase/lipase